MSLDFSNTCPAIDDAIFTARHNLYSKIEDIVIDCNHHMKHTAEVDGDFVDGYVDSLYEMIEDGFEGTRKTNEKMREQADYQIDTLEEEITELKIRIEELEEKTDSLEIQITDLEEDLANE